MLSLKLVFVNKMQAGRSSYVSADILATVPDPGAMAAASWYKAAALAVKNLWDPCAISLVFFHLRGGNFYEQSFSPNWDRSAFRLCSWCIKQRERKFIKSVMDHLVELYVQLYYTLTCEFLFLVDFMVELEYILSYPFIKHSTCLHAAGGALFSQA